MAAQRPGRGKGQPPGRPNQPRGVRKVGMCDCCNPSRPFCRHCYSHGHTGGQCEFATCFKCGVMGHLAEACQFVEGICRNCRAAVHNREDCPKPDRYARIQREKLGVYRWEQLERFDLWRQRQVVDVPMRFRPFPIPQPWGELRLQPGGVQPQPQVPIPRGQIHYQSPPRRVPSSAASPAVSRVKRRRQPSLVSPIRSSPRVKRRREKESEVVTSMQAVMGAVQMLMDRMEGVEDSVHQLNRKQIEIQRDLRDGLKRSFAPFEKPDRREASFLPTMLSSELPMRMLIEQERRTKTSRALTTRSHNEEGNVQGRGAFKERGGATKHMAGPFMPRNRQYGGQHRQERDERNRVDYRRCKEESRRAEMPAVKRGGGIVGKSRRRLMSPRVSKRVESTKEQPQQQTSRKRNDEEVQGTSADVSRSLSSYYPA